MNMEQAKIQLSAFLNGRELTFTVSNFDSGEWIAECNEIPGIITGGMGNDITTMDSLIRDAILVAAGLDSESSSNLLKFVGYKERQGLFGFFCSGSRAEYVLS